MIILVLQFFIDFKVVVSLLSTYSFVDSYLIKLFISLTFWKLWLAWSRSLWIILLVQKSATLQLLLSLRGILGTCGQLLLLTAFILWTLIHSLVIKKHALSGVIICSLEGGRSTLRPRIRVCVWAIVEFQVNILLRKLIAIGWGTR